MIEYHHCAFATSADGLRITWSRGWIAFGRKSRSSFGLAFAIGIAPDLSSFGVLYVTATLGLSPKPDFRHGTPPKSTISHYVHHLYNYTHSFVVFLAVFFLVWLFLKRPVWELRAWGAAYPDRYAFAFLRLFPTPVLWPLSDWKFDGWEWMAPGVLIPNFMLLSLLDAWYVRSLLDKSNMDAQPQAVSRPSTCEDPQLKKMHL